MLIGRQMVAVAVSRIVVLAIRPRYDSVNSRQKFEVCVFFFCVM